MKPIFEYLLSKKNNNALCEKFNTKMKPDDIIKLLNDFEVEELSTGEFHKRDPQENELYIMKSLNSFGGKNMKFNIKSRIYSFTFDETELSYISLEYNGQIYFYSYPPSNNEELEDLKIH